MRIAVMGTGGIGGFCGAKLAAKGADVFFIARGEHLNAMQSSGLKLLSALGDVTFPAKPPAMPERIEAVLQMRE